LITQAQADALKIKSGGMPFGRGHDGWFGLDRIDFNSLLAEELGITVGELSAAQVKAQDAQIDQAVTDGRITQEQADLMKGRRALAANEGFLSAMKSAYTEAVNKALAAGVITQAQADALLNDLETNGLFFKNGRHGLGGMEGFGRHGHGGSGFMGSGSDVPFQETTPPASSEDTSTSL